MSFTKKQIEMPQSSINAHKFKLCNKCEELRPPEGGINMSPSKWICAHCWVVRTTRRFK